MPSGPNKNKNKNKKRSRQKTRRFLQAPNMSLAHQEKKAKKKKIRGKKFDE
jgi:hypothetical protein